MTKLALLLLCALLALLVPGAEWIGRTLLAIVEAAATGIEVECGVLGLTRAQLADGEVGVEPVGAAGALAGRDMSGGDRAGVGAWDALALASEPGEIVVTGGREWYDYDAKYTPGGMDLIVPARISAAARDRVRELALQTFAAVGCQ